MNCEQNSCHEIIYRLYRSSSEFIVLLRVMGLVVPVPELDIRRIFFKSPSSNSPFNEAAVAYWQCSFINVIHSLATEAVSASINKLFSPLDPDTNICLSDCFLFCCDMDAFTKIISPYVELNKFNNIETSAHAIRTFNTSPYGKQSTSFS